MTLGFYIFIYLQTVCVASAGEYLTMRLRLLSYTSIIRQPMGWFDKDSNSPGRLATRLARDAPIVKAVCTFYHFANALSPLRSEIEYENFVRYSQAAGHRLATVLAAFVTIVAALSIAFYFGWQLALAILAGFPVLVVAGYIQIQVGKSGQKKDAVLMEEAGRVC